jgi:hypothetical protein
VTTPAALTARDLRAHIFSNRRDRLAMFSGLRKRPEDRDLQMPSTRYFDFPEQAEQAEAWARQQDALNREVYFCVHLLFTDRRIKENAAPIVTIWTDADAADLGKSPIEPTAVVESSPGRLQTYARLSRPVSPARAEELNKRWGLAFGADISGYDLSQVLREPGTRNNKYPDRPTVRILSIDDSITYDPDDLDRILPKLPDQERKASGPAAERDIDKADDELMAVMLRSRHGEKIRALLDNDADHLATHPELLTQGRLDGNKADLSLCNYLAFYYGTTERADAAFRRSKRMRDKWDAKHRGDGATYGEMTLEKAFAGRTEFYTPPGEGPDLAEGLDEQQAAVEEAEHIIAGGCCPGCTCGCKRVHQAERTAAVARQHVSAMTTIRKSTGLSGEFKNVAAALLTRVEDARRRGLSEVKIFYGDRDKFKAGQDPGGLARDAGTSPHTPQRFVKELRDRDGSPFRFETIEDDAGRPRVVVRFNPDSTIAADATALAGLTREKPQHGGTRTACPDHPKAPLIRTLACSECGQIVAQDTLNVDPAAPSSKLLQGIAAAHRRGSNSGRILLPGIRRARPPRPDEHHATGPTNGHAPVNGSANGHHPPPTPDWLKDADWATRMRWEQQQATIGPPPAHNQEGGRPAYEQ